MCVSYPWKLNDWEFAYSLVIKEIEQRITNSSNEEDKKKLRGDKTKLMNKMNKATEYGRLMQTSVIKTPLRELRKSYMFQLNGDILELSLLFDIL